MPEARGRGRMRKRQAVFSLAAISLVILIGTSGYVVFEGWGVLDSLYMTVITITTIGFGEVHRLSEGGRVFTIFLIFLGVGAVLYSLNNAARLLIEGELMDVFGRRKLEKKIRRLKGHYIICGWGRMGRIIGRELKDNKTEFVIVEKSSEASEFFGEDAFFIVGDATRDETLKEAGIDTAKGLISVLPTDAENLYVVLSARGLNPGLSIVARAGEDGSEQKLLRAGANRVISPYHAGAMRIAQTVLKPAVVDFIEFATQTGSIDIQMEEILVDAGSRLANLTLSECGIGRELGVLIVAVKTASGEMKVNPSFSSTIKSGDTLIALGETSRLNALEEMAGRG